MNRDLALHPVPAERRLAAILAADVVGYSRLMGADEVGTLRALKAMRGDVLDPTIAGYRGRIVKTTGDGVLVEFASVVDAVVCAVAIQRELRFHPLGVADTTRLILRIGVNIGDIIIDGEDIFGDGVNLAARLESICEPGGVTVSRAVHEQVRDKLAFPFVDLGEQTVKNIVRPLRVFGIGPEAIGAMPASALPARSEQAAALAPASLSTDAPRSKLRTWRRRLLLIAVAVFVLSRISPVRHAIDAVITWAAPTQEKAPQAKPPELAPLPPPIFVPAAPAPAATPDGADPPSEKPIELHPQDAGDH